MPLNFPTHVPVNDKNIPLSQRHWLTPEQRTQLVKKASIETKEQLENQAKLENELELIAKYKKPLIKKVLKH